MINLTDTIDDALITIVNTNNKEQNFQGRLYASLIKLEKYGYVVEMETNVKDDHLPFFPKDIKYKKKR